MCDALSKNHDLILYLPKVGENFVYKTLKKKFLLMAEKNLK